MTFPSALRLSEAFTEINYTRVDLGNRVAAVLPQSADFRMVMLSGETYNNHAEFAHCRVFGAESTINFDNLDREQTPTFATGVVDNTLRSLPAGLPVVVRLVTQISADTPVGALIDGVVAGDVRLKGAIAIPAGSPVRGRIRRLEHYTDPFSNFLVAFEFTEVELNGIRYRFSADSFRARARREANLGGWKGPRIIREHPGGRHVFHKGNKLELPRGLRTAWRTVSPAE